MIGTTLQKLIDEKNTNVNELARTIDVSAQTLYSIIKRDNMKIDFDVLLRICDALDVDVAVFYKDYIKNVTRQEIADNPTSLSVDEYPTIVKYRGLDDYGRRAVDTLLDEELRRCQEQKQQLTDMAESRVLYLDFPEQSASAGTGNYLFDETVEKFCVADNEATRKADICIRVQGDSMEPTYLDSNMLLVHRQPTVEIGEIGVFIVDGIGYVKEYGKKGLLSHNKKYPQLKFSEYSLIICVGKVLGKLDPAWIM